MFKNLIRTIFTIAGAIVGYGVFSLLKFVAVVTGHEKWVDFSGTEEVCLAAFFAIMF